MSLKIMNLAVLLQLFLQLELIVKISLLQLLVQLKHYQLMHL